MEVLGYTVQNLQPQNLQEGRGKGCSLGRGLKLGVSPLSLQVVNHDLCTPPTRAILESRIGW